MTTPSHLPTDPWREFGDGDVPTESEATREFWGAGNDWSSEIHRPAEPVDEHRGLAATVSRWWNSTGSIPATRVHGTPTTETPIQAGGADHRVEPDDDTDELDLDDWLVDAWADESPRAIPGEPQWDVDDHDDAVSDEHPPFAESWDAAPTPSRPMIDPLLARVGGVVILITLLVPAVLGFVSDSDPGDTLRTASEPATTDPAVATSPEAPAVGTEPIDDTVASTAAAVAPTNEPGTTPAPTTAEAPVAPVTAAADDPEPAAEQLVVDTCATEYEVLAGDFWIRIADGSGAALADLLAVNSATVSTPLYPGSTICLPAGATRPAPPTTASTGGQSSPTTAAPAPTAPPSTAAPTTAAPTTTSPPPPPASSASAAEVQAIIRAVWPDELEDRAIEIARRESNFIPTARNFCCYGVFQIYWSVHQGWLSGIGITSAQQLYDPTVNARAALALYERAGGWGPWGG